MVSLMIPQSRHGIQSSLLDAGAPGPSLCEGWVRLFVLVETD
jgi:hypothetical protein